MTELNVYYQLLFGLIVITSIIWFYLATKSKRILFFIIVWTMIQSILALLGVYQETAAMPPRIMLFGILPTLVFIAIVLFTKKGKSETANVNLKTLTYFHAIRIPVEVVLSMLYHAGVMSIYATYEGTNFDILSGLSAPIVAYYFWKSKNVNKKLLIGWNVICMILLLNVVITAIFAFPSPFQQLAFDQPNIAPLYFPFNLLPTLVVPLVLLAHFIALQRLLKA